MRAKKPTAIRSRGVSQVHHLVIRIIHVCVEKLMYYFLIYIHAPARSIERRNQFSRIIAYRADGRRSEYLPYRCFVEFYDKGSVRFGFSRLKIRISNCSTPIARHQRLFEDQSFFFFFFDHPKPFNGERVIRFYAEFTV